jgi:hypothetical protein
VASALLALVLVACADPTAPPTEPSTPRPSADLAAAGTSTAIVISPVPSEYSWSQGQPAVMMGSVSSSACFLTSIGGRFEGSTEWVGIVGRIGRWYLTGGSAQSGVRATARCISTTSYTAEVTVTTTNGQPNKKSLPGSLCGLTRIGGNLSSHFDGVYLDKDGTITAFADLGYFATGSARCVTSNSVVPAGGIQKWISWLAPLRLTRLASTVCVLAGVAGEYDAVGDWVGIRKGRDGWRLYGTNNYGNAAAAQCMKPGR